ncbi:MAG: CSLREA domain-containing protein [Deltaproteobacteria bacterium]|nr:CSLREA domain-containing protein [Deltaproteobacteria bacterium]
MKRGSFKSAFLYVFLGLFLCVSFSDIYANPGLGRLRIIKRSCKTCIKVNIARDISRNDGYCSLREAITTANEERNSGNKDGECDYKNRPVISLDANSEIYFLHMERVEINKSITIKSSDGSTIIECASPNTFKLSEGADIILRDRIIMKGCMPANAARTNAELL